MLDPEAIARLEKQQYRIVGSHSAVKVCGWTKKLIKGEGGCYKLKFYGIMSHQCLQMTPSMSCANRCTFCWRGYKAPVAKNWKWSVDDPKEIIDGSIAHHHDLLVGLKGSPKSDKQAYEQSCHVKHVALSLTGEPITYPRLNEMIDEFHKRGISTFLVTNATYPEQIKNLKPVTQLYISLDAPTRDLLKEIDRPLFPDYWERLNKSLEYMSQKASRTCIRLTVLKGVNDVHPKEYARLIAKAKPDFLEIKGYMFIGASRQRLTIENMPWHRDIVAFSKELMKFLTDYDIVAEHIPSRVVMCARKEFKKADGWHTWIDFDAFHELSTSGRDFSALDYVRKTPQTGISGKDTLDVSKSKPLKVLPQVSVNENEQEVDFWKGSQEDDQTL
ncbi:4-demethylwyosine synthase TYW1 [Candidatus Woesearchaeota archaeon]|nr:4-demethylwyosine synthase TYW1 [Candidatus Woesearchaeota archaeon]